MDMMIFLSKDGKWSWELLSFPININKTHVISLYFTIHYLILSYCELFVLIKISFISILFIKGRNFLPLQVSFCYFLCVWMHICLCLWYMCVVCTHVCVCKCVYLWLSQRPEEDVGFPVLSPSLLFPWDRQTWMWNQKSF